uniref:hypothetical protein n=1 Tax=Larkinella sp. C7 TaxID=2576607 RepID=UPI001BB292E8
RMAEKHFTNVAKKNFTGGLGALLGDSPKQEDKPAAETPAAPALATDAETRATFIVNESDLEKLRSIAYWDRLLIKDVLAMAISKHIAEYEEVNGPIKPAPKKAK